MTESSKGLLLVVDDEALKRVTLQIELSEADYTVLEAPDAPAALRILENQPVDVVITDVRMPEMDGLELLDRIRADFPRTQVMLMTAFSAVDAAVEAIKRGAYDYIAKPFHSDALIEKLDHLFASRTPLGGESEQCQTFGPLVGRSFASRRLFEQIQAVASRDTAVTIHGEPGTCRERVAQAIHDHSTRASAPLVKFACTASSPEMLCVELFGGSHGAAPGSPPVVGRFQMADGGTLYLDDVDALPLELQSRLLRAVEEGVAERAGDGQPLRADVRLIAATGRDLRALVDAGEFREDLYHRLEAVRIAVPPLRDRREDIPLLVERFLSNGQPSAPDGHTVPTRICPEALDLLVSYHWPGNLRELEHVLERAVTFATGEEIQARDILLPSAGEVRTAQDVEAGLGANGGLTETVAGVERTLITNALKKAAGNQAKAAQILGIPRTTLRDKMAKYGMVGRTARREYAS